MNEIGKKPTKNDWDKYAKEVIPKLKDLGYLSEEEVTDRTGLYLILSILAVGVIIAGVFYYVSWMGWLKSDISCPTLNCPSIPECNPPSCPACPSAPQCPTCPTNTCNFPSNLTIKLTNTTG